MVETTIKLDDSTLLLMMSVPTELYACVSGFRVDRCDDGSVNVKFDVLDLTLFAKLWRTVEQSEASCALKDLIGDWTMDGLDG